MSKIDRAGLADRFEHHHRGDQPRVGPEVVAEVVVSRQLAAEDAVVEADLAGAAHLVQGHAGEGGDVVALPARSRRGWWAGTGLALAAVLALAVGLALMASWMPARLVAKREPADGLRYE